MNTAPLRLAAAVLVLALSCATAQENKGDADNTDRNKQDQSSKTRTPIDQSNDPRTSSPAGDSRGPNALAAVRPASVRGDGKNFTAWQDWPVPREAQQWS